MPIRIIFFGSSDYCMPILDSLKRNFELKAVITKPDSPVGRRQILTPTEVKKYSQTHKIPVFTPANKKELINLKEDITKLKSDIAVVADYGIIIPKEIFSLPRLKTLNIHFSKLPDFRGASPIQYTILRGDNSGWISIILMDEKMDTGDILWQKEVKLNGKEITEELYKKLFNVVGLSLPEIINSLNNHKIIPQKQDHSKATYAKIFTRGDGFIPYAIIKPAISGQSPEPSKLLSWPLYREVISNFPITNQKLLTTRHLSLTAHSPQPTTIIYNAFRALSPWPGIWTNIQITENRQQITKRLKIIHAHVESITHNTPPTTKLVLDLVQLEGKNTVSWKQFTEGYPDILSPASLITCTNSL
ncbi:MAG: methionyl-tRNA formyltransferase [Patescibacteria group bacterium]|nr:methionyl-tRNA formyltransferase [Patescibacteria group bacterium]